MALQWCLRSVEEVLRFRIPQVLEFQVEKGGRLKRCPPLKAERERWMQDRSIHFASNKSVEALAVSARKSWPVWKENVWNPPVNRIARGKNVVQMAVEMCAEIVHRSICVRQMEPVFFRGVSPNAMDWSAGQMGVGIFVVSVQSLFFV